MKYEVRLLEEDKINFNDRVYPKETVKQICEQFNKKNYNVYNDAPTTVEIENEKIIGKTGKSYIKNGTLYVDVTLQHEPKTDFIVLSLIGRTELTLEQFMCIDDMPKNIIEFHNGKTNHLVKDPEVQCVYLSETSSFGGSTNLKIKSTINNE